MHFKTSKLIKDSAYPSIGLPDIENLEIPLPPLATQKRIAEILDAADALRRKDQELLKKYDELAQAIFIDMFGDPVKNEKGWEVLELENLCTDIADCPHTTPIHSSIITEFPCIRTSEMKNGKIFWGSMKYLDEEAYLNRVKRIEPNVGDIIYAREGTYGQAVLLPKGFNFALGQRTMLLRPDTNKISNEFLWYQINSDFVYRQAKKKNMGSTVGHVNVADVKKFNIIRPPLNLQMKFAETIKQLCNLEILMADKYSDTLFNSLIQKAFKGELV
jgi:type I restriction enzyme S subunit